MTTSHRERTTIELNPGDKDRLQAIAKRYGFIQSRGNTKGKGSISALMRAIADGEIVITVKA